jgi:hypothetical protein
MPRLNNFITEDDASMDIMKLLAKAMPLLKGYRYATYKMGYNFTITASLEFMIFQLSFQFFMVIDLSVHLEMTTRR